MVHIKRHITFQFQILYGLSASKQLLKLSERQIPCVFEVIKTIWKWQKWFRPKNIAQVHEIFGPSPEIPEKCFRSEEPVNSRCLDWMVAGISSFLPRASVWTHKTLLELELFVHSWGSAWTHKAHYKTSLVWAVCPLLEKYCSPLWEQCFCPLFELLLTVGAMLLSSMGALFLDSSPCWAEVTHHAWDLHPDQFILRDIDCSNSVCENGKRYQRCSR